MAESIIQATRNKNLYRALRTALVARGAGFFLQVISLPLAAISLGVDGFSVYAMLVAILNWLGLSNIGISQATTLHIASESESELRAHVFIISLILTLIIATTISVTCIILVFSTPIIEWLFQRQTHSFVSLYKSILFICCVYFITQILSVFEAAQLAQQRQDRTNLFNATGTIIAAVAVYMVTRHPSNVFDILLAVYLPVLGTRCVNAVLVFRTISPINVSILCVRGPRSGHILRDGLSFMSGSTIGNFLCHPLTILIVGASTTSVITAQYAAVMNAVILAASVFALLAGPFAGALPEAHLHGDWTWIRKSYKLTLLSAICYALFPSVLFAVFGQNVFTLWYRGSIVPVHPMLLGAGLYVLVLAAEVINYNFLSNLQCLQSASKWILLKAIITALAVIVLVASGNVVYTFYVLALVQILFSTIPLTSMMFRRLRVCDSTNIYSKRKRN